DAEHGHRIYVSLILQYCPRLVQCFGFDRKAVCVQMGPVGAWLVTREENGHLQVWNVLAGPTPTLRATVPIGKEEHPIAISADGGLIAVAAANGSTRVWELATARPRTWLFQPRAAVEHAGFSEDNRALILHLADRSVEVRDTQTGQSIASKDA